MYKMRPNIQPSVNNIAPMSIFSRLASSTFILFIMAPSLACSMAAPQLSVADVSSAFSKAGLVPGVIPVFQPSGIVDVVFTDPATQKNANATVGTNLTVQQTTNEPNFFLTSDNTTALSNGQFVVALFDPDAPTPQNTSLAQFRHLVGGGYRWNASSGMLANSTPALTEFVPPGPPAGSDPHRYMLLVFVQSEDFVTKGPSLLNATTPRTNFNITGFSNALGLGSPFAGTFWYTGPEVATTSGTSAGASTATSAPAGSAAVSNRPRLQLATIEIFSLILAVFLLS